MINLNWKLLAGVSTLASLIAISSADDIGKKSVEVSIAKREIPLNLEQAIARALDTSSSLQIAAKQLDIDRAMEGSVGSQLKPHVGFNVSATRFDAPSVIDFGTSKVTALQEHLEILSLSIEQKLDILGKIKLSKSQVHLQQEADKAAFEGIALNRVFQAKVAYFDYLRSRHQVNVAESGLKDSVAHENIARRLFENKVGQKVDLLRAETNTAQAQQNVTAAKNSADIALANLNNLVGRPLDLPIELEDVEGVGVGDDIRASKDAISTNPTELLPHLKLFRSPAESVNNIDVNNSISIAQTRRPDIVRNAAIARAQEVGVRVAKHGLDPEFNVSLTGSHYPTPSFQYVRPSTVALSFVASIPIFDGGRTKSEIEQAKSKQDQAKLSLESSKSDAALTVRQSYLNLQTAARQIDSVNVALSQAIAARQLAQVRYEAQVGLYLEIADAQAALVRAESIQVDAVYNYLIARAAFENAVGLDLKHQTNTVAIPASSPKS